MFAMPIVVNSKSEKIRILHVLDKISVGSGVSAVVMNYYAGLEHESLTFDFMLNEDTNPATRTYIEGNGSRIYVMPRLKLVNIFKYISALRAFYKNHDYQIIHGHVANSAVFYLGMAKYTPYRILHSHSTKLADVPWKRVRNWILTRFIKTVANRYMACSKEAATLLFGSADGVIVLPNAIDVDRFRFNEKKRDKIRLDLGLKSETVIGHVGRFTPVKNQGFLLDVFSEIYKLNSNARLMLIGGGGLHGDIMQRTKSLGIDEAVIFIGQTDSIEDYMCAMDIFVLPSLFEGLGLVAVEAQASGLNVLVSERVPRIVDVTGSTEFLRLDKGLWIDAIIRQVKNEDRQKQADKVKGSLFDIGLQGKELLAYYYDLLSY